MNPSAKRFSVILMSFIVILVSGGVTYIVWSTLDQLGSTIRDVVSLFFWVLTFYVGAHAMWRGVLRLSNAA